MTAGSLTCFEQLGSGAAMRLYFHLADRLDIIPDREGVEVADLRQVRAEVLQVLAELRREDASAARDWLGWRLTVTDAAHDDGTVVLALDLDRVLN